MIGMTSVTFRNKNVDEVIAICKEAGIDSIEWGADVHVKAGDVAFAEEVYKKTTDAGLKVSSYGSYFKVGVDDMEEFGRVLASAEALHAKYIRIWMGDKSSSKTSSEEYAKYVEELKALAKMAGEKDIIIASEFHNNTYNDGLVPAKKLLDDVDSPYYKTYWQTIAYDDSDMESLKGLLPSVVNIHTFTWNHWGKRYPLKKKKKMWASYIAVAGSDALYTIEFVKNDSDKYFLKDVNTLKELLR